MSRPSCISIDKEALLHNLKIIKQYAKNTKIIAMVKCNAYGCGINLIVPTLLPYVYGFGIASLEEAIEIRKISLDCECILFQGFFSVDELKDAYKYRLQIAIHHQRELDWILANPANGKMKIWVKINTGMHRLGFGEEEVPKVIESLIACPWVDADIKLMTHLACADSVGSESNIAQLKKFAFLVSSYNNMQKSIANSAAIISLPEAHVDIVRAGLMLYGASPFSDKTGLELGLKPVMHLVSKITTIYHYEANAKIGYGGTWQSDKPSIIGIVPIGYGDGYPRRINNAKVWVCGQEVPVVGLVSMDMLTIDLTNCPNAKLDDEVELWGSHIPIEDVASAAGLVAYELLTRISNRVIRQ